MNKSLEIRPVTLIGERLVVSGRITVAGLVYIDVKDTNVGMQMTFIGEEIMAIHDILVNHKITYQDYSRKEKE